MNWTRRDLMKMSTLGVAAGMLPRGLAAQQAPAPPPTPAIFTPIRRNFGIFLQRGGAIGWLVNKDGVLVIDTQFADTAPNFVSGLKERTPRQIDIVLNSHHHPDHTGGNTVLKAAAKKIVAHERSKENQRVAAERAKAQVTLPDETFKDTWKVTIGDETVSARHWGPAHTGGDVAIHFEKANIVHLGDLLNNRGYPNLDAPAGASLQGWMSVLEKMAPHYAADTLYIYGHAESGYPYFGTRPDLMSQRDYFSAVLEATRRGMKEGKSRDELAKTETLAGFEHFGGTKSRLGLAFGIAFDELSKKS